MCQHCRSDFFTLAGLEREKKTRQMSIKRNKKKCTKRCKAEGNKKKRRFPTQHTFEFPISVCSHVHNKTWKLTASSFSALSTPLACPLAAERSHNSSWDRSGVPLLYFEFNMISFISGLHRCMTCPVSLWCLMCEQADLIVKSDSSDGTTNRYWLRRSGGPWMLLDREADTHVMPLTHDAC